MSTDTTTTTTKNTDKPLSETGGLNIPEQRLSFQGKAPPLLMTRRFSESQRIYFSFFLGRMLEVCPH